MHQSALSRLSLAVSIVAIAGAAVPFAASAQTVPPGQQDENLPEALVQNDPQTDVGSTGDVAEEQLIVVTGSRIARPKDFTSASPLISLDSKTIQTAGTTNLTDFLTGYPALTGSTTSADTSGDDAGIGFAGLNLLDLRNLGTQRTLLLVDGRRHVASVPGSQSIDVNSLPSDLIERVEIVTGGASALYGADAVSGVVNFILKRDFEGLRARAQTGISQEGDAGQRLATVTAGRNIANGRGNIAIAYEYGAEDRLLSQDRRRYNNSNLVGFYRNLNDTEGPGEKNDGIPDNILFGDLRYFDTRADGAVDVNFDGVQDFNGDGTPFVPGQYLDRGVASGGSGTPLSRYANDLLPDVERHVVNLIGRYEFSPAVEVYAEGKYARTNVFTLSQPTYDYYLFVPEDNPFIPATVRNEIIDGFGEAVFGPGGLDGVLVTRDNFDFGQRGQDNRRETFRSVLGVRGNVTDAIQYDLSYVYGQTKVRANFVNDIYDDRFFAALDAVVDPATGQATCRINLDPTWTPFQPFQDPDGARGGGLGDPVTFQPGDCVPINPFGEGQSQAALDFIRADTTDRSKIQQHVLSGVISGTLADLISLPGGAPGFAVGAEYRKEKSRFVSDEIARRGLTFTNAIDPTVGKFDVKEVFGEMSLPIIADRPFFHRLDVGGAIRFSDYSTIGSTTTWQLNGLFAPVRDIAFKGTYSQAVRAPNISELFGGKTQTFLFVTDPCNENQIQNAADPDLRKANCTALLSSLGVADPARYLDVRSTSIPGIVSGNSDLTEETAKIWTAGVSLQPRFLRGLDIAIDWYDIELEDAITTPTLSELAALCVDQPSLENPFCARIDRQNGPSESASNLPGNVVGFRVAPENVAAFATSGLDVNLNYRFATDNMGTFNLRLIGNYLDTLTTIATQGAEPIESSGTIASPKYQVNGDLSWQNGPLVLNYGLSWHDKTARYALATLENNPDVVEDRYKYIKERWQHDIFASYDIEDRFQIYGGINNFTNNKPDIGQDSEPISSVGRYFYAGARVTFDRLGF